MTERVLFCGAWDEGPGYPRATALRQALAAQGVHIDELKAPAMGQEKQKLLLEAGLNFMRVYTFFKASEIANEALYEAAVVNVELGNKPAARAAFKMVIERSAGSAIGKKAVEGLESLDKK